MWTRSIRRTVLLALPTCAAALAACGLEVVGSRPPRAGEDAAAADVDPPDTTSPRDDGEAGPAEAGADAASPTACVARRRVFVTTMAWTADQLGGLAGADAHCNVAAAGLGGDWVAWVSTGGPTPIHAIERISSTACFVRAHDGQLLFANASQIRGGIGPITGLGTAEAPVGGDVLAWTGTGATGLATGADCVAWTIPSTASATVGRPSAGGAAWTQDTPVPCTGARRLICVEK